MRPRTFCFTIRKITCQGRQWEIGVWNMEDIKKFLMELLNDKLIRIVISNPRDRDGVIKVKVRPVLKKGELLFQAEEFTKTQAFHKNCGKDEMGTAILEYMERFRQLQAETTAEDVVLLISKKGKVTLRRKPVKQEGSRKAELSHNRKKRYILEEGKQIPFLQDLGVMTGEGKIVHSRMDKFRQINRFLEFIEDILPQLDRGRELTILDFGCGKSYLTFAMYYYLRELCGYDVRIIGLDLKEEVIQRCSELAARYGYEKLTFLVGDIAQYSGVEKVDLVVTLHACDTATDYALAKAVGWGAKVILSVPCCQHELNGQMEKNGQTQANQVLAPVLRYGLLRERFAALVTDGLRASYLEQEGYETQVLEFIDLEHTPKNVLIRAVKKGKQQAAKRKEIADCEHFLSVEPALGRILADTKGRRNQDDKEDY